MTKTLLTVAVGLVLAGCGSQQLTPQQQQQKQQQQLQQAQQQSLILPFEMITDGAKIQAGQARQNALEFSESGQREFWQSTDSIMYGYATPIQTFELGEGTFCRRIQDTYVLPTNGIGDRKRIFASNWCRYPDGQWGLYTGDIKVFEPDNLQAAPQTASNTPSQ